MVVSMLIRKIEPSLKCCANCRLIMSIAHLYYWFIRNIKRSVGVRQIKDLPRFKHEYWVPGLPAVRHQVTNSPAPCRGRAQQLARWRTIEDLLDSDRNCMTSKVGSFFRQERHALNTDMRSSPSVSIRRSEDTSFTAADGPDS